MGKKIIHKATRQEIVLFNELSQLIEKSQQQLVATANSTLTMLFWHIGDRINKSILQNKRADYGKRLSLHCHDNWRQDLEIILKKRI
jgi:DUF1016 N-terminal domain